MDAAPNGTPLLRALACPCRRGAPLATRRRKYLFTAPLSTSPACHAHGGHGHAGARGEAEKHRITWVSVGVNVALSACKLFAGVVGNSAAMPVNAISPAVSRRGL